MKMPRPEDVPERGFYYHYKHNPAGPINNYAYEVLGVGCHTEETCSSEDVNMVIYRPLYPDATVFKAGKLFDLRPLVMFMDNVYKGDKHIPRFRKITNPAISAELTKIRDEMYSD
jgi:hypothetical protein